MTSPQTDIRALRRAAAPTLQTHAPTAGGEAALVPRPRARWTTRLFLPAAVLLATCGILAYAARDVLRPRLAVHVAAVIPKSGLVPAPTDEAQGTIADADGSGEAPLGPVVVQAPGWIEPAPFAVSVPALAEGVVKEVLVLEGERVEADQVVARFIDDDARLGLRAAAAAVGERVSDVERAKAALATAESQVLVERSAVEELRDEVTRSRDLVGVGAVPLGEFRRMEIRLGGLEAKVATATSTVSEARAALVQADAARDAALVAQDEAALQLSRMEVRSPTSGVVLARLVEPGSRISMSDNGGNGATGSSMTGTVLRIYDPAKLQVRVDVPLADAAKVGVGTRATVSTEALPDQVFSGVVSRVVHEANIQRNTVQFKVALDMPSPVLKAEMLTRVKLHGPSTTVHGRRSGASAGGVAGDGDTGDQLLLIPTAALEPTGEGTGHVWIVDAGSGTPIARQREITTLPASDEGYVIVNSGLRLTDRVILDPPAPPAIKDGTRLKVLGERTSPASNVDPNSP